MNIPFPRSAGAFSSDACPKSKNAVAPNHTDENPFVVPYPF
jgi:hypothetical protein